MNEMMYRGSKFIMSISIFRCLNNRRRPQRKKKSLASGSIRPYYDFCYGLITNAKNPYDCALLQQWTLIVTTNNNDFNTETKIYAHKNIYDAEFKPI